MLDLSSRIGEGTSGLLSMTQARVVAGVPCVVTTDPTEAVLHPVVYLACRVSNGVLTADAVDLLDAYLIIAPRLSRSDTTSGATWWLDNPPANSVASGADN